MRSDSFLRALLAVWIGQQCVHAYGGFGLFGDAFSNNGFMQHPRHRRPYNLDTLQRPVCAPYKGVSTSKWYVAGADRAAAKVTLPAIRPEHVNIHLSSDGSSLELGAWRSINTFGGRQCLPRDATISRDGRGELLALVIAVPSGVDVADVKIKHTQDGLLLIAPLTLPRRAQETDYPRSRSSSMKEPPTVSRASSEASPSSNHGAQTAPTSAPVHPNDDISLQSHAATLTHAEEVQSVGESAQVMLPSSDGIEIEDEEFPEVEKNDDASAGWWDNRGEFHEYGE